MRRVWPSFGHRVIGVDIDARRVDVLNSGRSTIFERDLEPMLARHTSTGRLRFTTDYREVADWADVHFVAVGTPANPDGSADLSQVFAVAETLGPLLTRPTVIAGKSTVPVGTAIDARGTATRTRAGGRRRRGDVEPRVSP